MKERIKELRKNVGLTQVAFGESVGLTQNYIAQIEMGRREPSDRAIQDLVRIYNVNEEWLRTGNGSMFLELTYADEVAKFCGEVLHADPDDPRMELMRILAKLPFEDWQLVSDFIDAIKSQK